MTCQLRIALIMRRCRFSLSCPIVRPTPLKALTFVSATCKAKRKDEFQQLLAKVRANIDKLPPGEKEKLERKKTKPIVGLPDNVSEGEGSFLPGGSELGDDLSEYNYDDPMGSTGETAHPFFMDEYRSRESGEIPTRPPTSESDLLDASEVEEILRA